jgi:hypothetical protein
MHIIFWGDMHDPKNPLNFPCFIISADTQWDLIAYVPKPIQGCNPRIGANPGKKYNI